MDTQRNHLPGRALRWLDTSIRGLRILLILLTVFIGIWLVIQLVTGSGSLTVPAAVAEPVEITFEDGRYLGVDQSGHIATYGNFNVGEEHKSLTGNAVVAVDINVGRDDIAGRSVVVALLIAWLGAAWVGLVALGRVVSSALAGHPFENQNPSRLRALGAAIVSVPIASLAAQQALNSILETDIDVRMTFDESWLMLLVVGLACFGLAEVFAEATRLREFEEATI